MLKTVLLLLSFLPLLLHSPYLLQAWQNSRLDHWDWIFYLAAVPAAVWALYKEKLGKYDEADMYEEFDIYDSGAKTEMILQ